MRYSDDTLENEQEKVRQGEREIITDEMLNLFVGSDNPNGNAWEMLLDILNDQLPVKDIAGDIKGHFDEYGEEEK